jgi:hypothetical protein
MLKVSASIFSLLQPLKFLTTQITDALDPLLFAHLTVG